VGSGEDDQKRRPAYALDEPDGYRKPYSYDVKKKMKTATPKYLSGAKPRKPAKPEKCFFGKSAKVFSTVQILIPAFFPLARTRMASFLLKRYGKSAKARRAARKKGGGKKEIEEKEAANKEEDNCSWMIMELNTRPRRPRQPYKRKGASCPRQRACSGSGASKTPQLSHR
jgi:hypothetical protein